MAKAVSLYPVPPRAETMSVFTDPHDWASAPAVSDGCTTRKWALRLMLIRRKPGVICHAERSVAKSRHLAANLTQRPSAARFLRAAFGLGRNDNGASWIPSGPLLRPERPCHGFAVHPFRSSRERGFCFSVGCGYNGEFVLSGERPGAQPEMWIVYHRGNEIEALGLLGIWLDIQRR